MARTRLQIETAHSTRRSRLLEQRLTRRLSEDWQPGDRLPPIEKLARDMGVGITNMRRAAKALADRGLLIARPGAGTFVSPTIVAANDASEMHTSTHDAPLAGKIVHLLVPNHTTDGMLRDMMRATVDEVADAGATVVQDVWQFTDPDDLLNRAADALILFNAPTMAVASCRDDQWIMQASTTVQPRPTNCRGCDVITIDQEQGASLAGEHANSLGYKSFLFLGRCDDKDNSAPDQTSMLRLRGFEAGFTCKADKQHILVNRYDNYRGAKAVATYMKRKRKPELIFAASDDLAIGFIYGMAAYDKLPGRDFQIIGFDALKAARFGAGTGIPLTSVETPAKAMGKTAGRLLIERARDPELPTRTVQLTCNMHLGSSAVAKHATGKA